MKSPKELKNPTVKATIRYFAENIRGEGISPSMREIQIGIIAEQLRDDHGIRIRPERLDQLIDEVEVEREIDSDDLD